jgi:hypothetical protein
MRKEMIQRGGVMRIKGERSNSTCARLIVSD